MFGPLSNAHLSTIVQFVILL